MRTGTETVRRATEADVPGLTEMLARAFEDDPVAEWGSPKPSTRLGMLERFYRARLRQLLPHGEVWVSTGGQSAALWTPPGAWKTTLREDLEMFAGMLSPALLPRLPLVARGLLRIEKSHPPQPPHWYLAVLATNPAAQGRGLGGAVLAPVLEQCDRDGIPAYLESSKHSNIAYYARFGFRVTETVQLPGGPDIWLMWREPRGG